MTGSNCRKAILFLILAAGVMLLLLSASAATAHAQVERVNDARTRIGPGSATTYTDLVKTVFPDARAYRTAVVGPNRGKQRTGSRIDARRSIPLRNLFGRFDAVSFAGSMSVKSLAALRIRTPEGERLLLLMSVGAAGKTRGSTTAEDVSEGRELRGDEQKIGDLNVLALFRLAPKIELLDAVDVKKSKERGSVYFSDAYARLRIRAGQDGFFIINRVPRTDYPITSLSYSLLTASGDRLKILTSDTELQFDESTRCVSTNRFSVSFKVVRAPQKNGYRPLKVRQIDYTTNRTKNCKAVASRFKTTMNYDLIWNESESKYELTNPWTDDVYDTP